MTKSQNTKKDLCITSISVDMSTEEAPYNRIYTKPVEKQGDILLCEFESANYDIEQKELRKENAQLKERINKYFLDAINRGTANAVKAVKEFGMPERIEELVKQNDKFKELLKGCSVANTALVGIMDWLRETVIPEQRENCEKLFKNAQELQKLLDEVLQ